MASSVMRCRHAIVVERIAIDRRDVVVVRMHQDHLQHAGALNLLGRGARLGDVGLDEFADLTAVGLNGARHHGMASGSGGPRPKSAAFDAWAGLYPPPPARLKPVP